jgi:preprotein translocase subunit SecG
MVFTFLLVVLVVVSLVLIAAVLLQSGKGGGVAASFGGVSSSADAFIGQRQAGNLLTKISWIGGGLFLFLAFVLQILSTRASSAPESVLDRLSRQPAAAPPATKGAGTRAGGSALAGHRGSRGPALARHGPLRRRPRRRPPATPRAQEVAGRPS